MCLRSPLQGDTLIGVEPELELLTPWISPHSPDDVARELQREVGLVHPLHSKSVKALAVAQDRDDVLFEVDGPTLHYAVVHLTWSGKTEPSADWPRSQFFNSLADWIAWMKADHDDYIRGE